MQSIRATRDLTDWEVPRSGCRDHPLGSRRLPSSHRSRELEDAAVGRELRHSLVWHQCEQLGIKGRQELKKLVHMDDAAA